MELHQIHSLAEYQALLTSKQDELIHLADHEKALARELEGQKAVYTKGISWTKIGRAHV